MKHLEIINVLKDEIISLESDIAFTAMGQVVKIFDGIAIVYGLETIGFNEIVCFETGAQGVVFNIEKDSFTVVVLGYSENIKEGENVMRKKKFFETPVGKGLLGRAVNVLGNSIDNKGVINNVVYKNIEVKAPGIMSRKLVNEPMQTGIKFIDCLIPIGRGQRELIIGDRQCGKTSIAVDAILSQKKCNKLHDNNKKLYCIYVAIGQKKSSIAKIIKKLHNYNALEYTIIVVASASDPASLQFYAPYVGCTMGEFFRDNGMHALIVYDDLSKHSISYREISLVLKRSVGREAYPGDIFYVHAKLLERSAQLSKNMGGGSLTALPIVETVDGDITAYIPTTIISITDGQIFLEKELFNKDIKPAINIGGSVSRVGSTAQTKIMRKVVGGLKNFLSNYFSSKKFDEYSSDDTNLARNKIIKKGDKIIELLKQDLHAPLQISEQIILMFIVMTNLLELIDIKQIKKFESKLLSHIHNDKNNFLGYINKENALSKNKEKDLTVYLKKFIKLYF